MYYSISLKNYIYASFFSLISLVLLLVSGKIVGEHFYYDSITLKEFLNVPIKDNFAIITESSYAATAFVYQLVGIDGSISNLTQLSLSWIMYLIVIFSYFSGKTSYIERIHYFAFLALITLFYSVYIGQISKETLVVVMMWLIFRSGKINLLLATFLITVYGLYIREYWLLIGVLFLINYFILTKTEKINLIKLFIINFFGIFLMSVIHIILFNDNLTSYRYQVNEYRMFTGDVNTILLNPFTTINPIHDVGNFLFGLGNIFIPLDGLNSMNELVYYIWIVIVISVLYSKVKKVVNRNHLIAPFALLVSFVFVQAIFEPDMGSILKHQIGLFPVFLSILSIEEG
ncbi:hypothetical protein [Exiguobacterium sp. s149]|uniref:hypothetical protein n=1 Tax=Exiguobacterium TaxID=33986 RepID=UPI001BE7E4A5|nr:hypothetical protein [Exiguobacterium sp. s149]